MHKTLWGIVIVLGVVIIVLATVLIFKPKTEQPMTGFGDQVQSLSNSPGGNPPNQGSATATEPSVQPVLESPKISTSTTKTNNMHNITLKTNLGDITFETYDTDAPKAVANFISLAEKKFYDGVIFHRIIPGFMIQGGDPTGTGRGGPGYSFEDELNPVTDSYKAGYKKGVVAMANAGPDTNGSQFFIMLADYPLPNQYTIFGKVIAGQEVVDKMGALPTGANDRPLTPPVIESVSVVAK